MVTPASRRIPLFRTYKEPRVSSARRDSGGRQQRRPVVGPPGERAVDHDHARGPAARRQPKAEQPGVGLDAGRLDPFTRRAQDYDIGEVGRLDLKGDGRGGSGVRQAREDRSAGRAAERKQRDHGERGNSGGRETDGGGGFHTAIDGRAPADATRVGGEEFHLRASGRHPPLRPPGVTQHEEAALVDIDAPGGVEVPMHLGGVPAGVAGDSVHDEDRAVRDGNDAPAMGGGPVTVVRPLEVVEDAPGQPSFDPRARGGLPVERTRGHRLRPAVERQRVVHPRRTEAVAHFCRHRVRTGAGIDQQGKAAERCGERQRIRVRVAAIQVAMRSAVDNQVVLGSRARHEVAGVLEASGSPHPVGPPRASLPGRLGLSSLDNPRGLVAEEPGRLLGSVVDREFRPAKECRGRRQAVPNIVRRSAADRKQRAAIVIADVRQAPRHVAQHSGGGGEPVEGPGKLIGAGVVRCPRDGECQEVEIQRVAVVVRRAFDVPPVGRHLPACLIEQHVPTEVGPLGRRPEFRQGPPADVQAERFAREVCVRAEVAREVRGHVRELTVEGEEQVDEPG